MLETPLIRAAHNGHLAAVSALSLRGPTPTRSTPGTTPPFTGRRCAATSRSSPARDVGERRGERQRAGQGPRGPVPGVLVPGVEVREGGPGWEVKGGRRCRSREVKEKKMQGKERFEGKESFFCFLVAKINNQESSSCFSFCSLSSLVLLSEMKTTSIGTLISWSPSPSRGQRTRS